MEDVINNYNNVNNVEYNISDTEVFCILNMKDGTIKEGSALLEEKFNVYGYYIKDIKEAKLNAFENALLH